MMDQKTKDFLYDYDVVSPTIDASGKINSKYMVKIIPDYHRYKSGGYITDKFTKLPVEFGTTGSFDCSNNDLVTLEGCPTTIKGTFNCSGNKNITNLDHFPSFVRISIDIADTGITSLMGISQKLHSMRAGGVLRADFSKITDGGLELLLIEGLNGLTNSGKASKQFKIIHKYLKDPAHDIFACQQELIEKGFEQFAIL